MLNIGLVVFDTHVSDSNLHHFPLSIFEFSHLHNPSPHVHHLLTLPSSLKLVLLPLVLHLLLKVQLVARLVYLFLNLFLLILNFKPVCVIPDHKLPHVKFITTYHTLAQFNRRVVFGLY
jgi:hypothetical protein